MHVVERIVKPKPYNSTKLYSNNTNSITYFRALCTIQCSPPIITLHVEQDDVEDLTVRAESVDDARRWLKAFLVASPLCRVQFKGTLPTARMSDGFTMEGAARYSTTSRDTKDDAKVEDMRFAI